MNHRTIALAFTFAAVCAGAAFAQQTRKGGLDENGPYDVQLNWFKPGMEWDQPVAAVAVETPDRIFIGNADQHVTRPNSLVIGADGVTQKERSKTSAKPEAEKTHLHQIMVLNGDGKVIADWAQWNDLIVTAHSLHISPYDPQRHLWVVDRDGQQILKFTNDGKKLVLKLGEKNVAGTDQGHFNRPASLVFLPDGSFYVADGYVNARVVKFDKNGKFLLEWGTKGSGPGQFNLVHSVAVDAQKRVYVADRSNNRIQVFDENGKFLDQWPDIRMPSRVVVTEDQSVWVSSAAYSRIARFDTNGKLLTYWGTFGDAPGSADNLHAFAVDDAGNYYVADTWNNRVQKFSPRADADKSRLMAREFRFKTP